MRWAVVGPCAAAATQVTQARSLHGHVHDARCTVLHLLALQAATSSGGVSNILAAAACTQAHPHAAKCNPLGTAAKYRLGGAITEIMLLGGNPGAWWALFYFLAEFH